MRVVYCLVFPAGCCWGRYHLFRIAHGVDTKQPEPEVRLSTEATKEQFNEAHQSWALSRTVRDIKDGAF